MQLVTGMFNESYDPIIDGVSVATKNYALWLNRMLGPSWVIAPGVPGFPEAETPNTIRYGSVPVPGRAPYRFGVPRLDRGMMAKLQRVPFDLVHAHSPFSAGRLALHTARQRGIPIVGTFHTKYRDNFEQVLRLTPLVDWQVRRIVGFYRQLDEVWVPSRPTVDVLRDYGFDKPIEVVANGTDFEPSDDSTLGRDVLETEWSIAPQETVLLYVGQLIWEKNLALLIEALAHLQRTGRPFRMVFVGDGYARPEMERIVRQSGLAKAVLFTGALADREELGSWYARADLFVFPSLYDTSALVLREAASFAVPTVLTRGSIPANEIEHGVNGFLADNRAEAFAAAVGEALDRPELLAEAGRGARRTLYRSWHDVVDDVKDRYLQLVRRSRGSSPTAD